MKEKNVLHQLLAVEQDKKKTAFKTILETINTFKKKDFHFDGLTKVYVSFAEEGDKFPSESKELVDTIKNKLKYSKDSIIKGIDAQLSKEETNASGTAKADLMINGESFGELSATSLLALETYFSSIRNMYGSIPTLDPTKKWEFDKSTGVYSTAEFKTYRTEKQPKVIVKYDATDKHPAQTEVFTFDQQVGEWSTYYKSGKLTPADKSKLLTRIDELIEAIKIARTKANSVEAKQIKIGGNLFNYINRDII